MHTRCSNLGFACQCRVSPRPRWLHGGDGTELGWLVRFVRHAYFTGAEEPYDKLKRARRADLGSTGPYTAEERQQ